MRFFSIIAACLLLIPSAHAAGETAGTPKDGPVFIIPIREDIEPEVLFHVRRGVKEAMDAGAHTIIVDMNTNGGRMDTMEEIMELFGSFKGNTITFVNSKAFSAGAFIAVSTKHIYMSPSSVIGAAAPILATPEGGVVETKGVLEKKMSSAASALIRAAAQKNGYNQDLVDAMVKETEGLTIDGKQIVKKGDILTLTDVEATATYGKPPKPLLAEGTAKDLDDLLKQVNLAGFKQVLVEPTGMEKIARFITLISPILLLIGISGIYLEFKTPGAVLPGAIAAVALFIYFFGHYVAGLSGYEEITLFIIGVVLLVVEIYVFPGHVLPGLLGIAAIMISLVWAMVDKIPLGGGFATNPTLPSFQQLQWPLAQLIFAMFLAPVLVMFAGRWLTHTKAAYGGLILQTRLDRDDGFTSADTHSELVGQTGTTVSLLRPSGTARIGDRVVDVITEGDFISANEKIIVKEVRGAQVVVGKV